MKKFLRNNRGVTAIEFAILAPVFFLLFLGIIEIGLTMFVDSTMSSALRIAARQGVPTGYNNSSEVRTVMQPYMGGIYATAPKMSIVVLPIRPPSSAGSGVNLTDANRELNELETFATNFRNNPDSFFAGGDSFTGNKTDQSGAITIYAARYEWGGFSRLVGVFLPDYLYSVTVVRNEVF